MIRAVAVAFRLWAEFVAGERGGSVWTDDGLTCVHWPGEPSELLMPFPARVSEPALDRALAFAAEHDVNLVGCWETGLEADPALEDRLRARGFHPAWVPHWMATPVPEATPGPAPEETVVALGEPGRSRGTLVLPPGSDVAGLFDVRVEAEHRRQGLGARITADALSVAARAGRAHLALSATEEGERLYRALGFESLGRGRTWYRG